MWEEREAKKPLRERKPVPSAPVEIPLGTSGRNIDAQNALAYEAYFLLEIIFNMDLLIFSTNK